MALITTHMSVLRGRPPGLAGGMSASRIAHCGRLDRWDSFFAPSPHLTSLFPFPGRFLLVLLLAYFTTPQATLVGGRTWAFVRWEAPCRKKIRTRHFPSALFQCAHEWRRAPGGRQQAVPPHYPSLLRVREGPVPPVCGAGKDRAGFGCCVADGDHYVERLAQIAVQRLRSLTREIDADLGHGANRQGSNQGRFRSRAICLEALSPQRAQPRCLYRHLCRASAFMMGGKGPDSGAGAMRWLCRTHPHRELSRAKRPTKHGTNIPIFESPPVCLRAVRSV